MTGASNNGGVRAVWRSGLGPGGYDLRGRVEAWRARGLLTPLAANILMQALADGHDMHAYRDALGRAVVEMDGETYPAREWNDLIAAAALAGGELMVN